MKRTIDVTDANGVLSQISVIDYFTIEKKEYLIYEKGLNDENKKIYLSKLVDNTLVAIDPEDIAKLQTVIKGLLSNDKKELHKYKKLDVVKIAANLIEQSSQKIAVTDEQYNNLTNEPVEKKKSKTLPILLVLIVLLVVVGTGLYFFVFGKEEIKPVENYTVKFVTGTDITLDDVTVESGGYVSLLNAIPVRNGYTFEGWYLDRNYTTPVGGSYQPSGNTLLYAKWQLIEVCEGDCVAGQTVYLIDDSAWKVVTDSSATDSIIILMAMDILPVQIAFDDCASGVCTSEYELASIKTYLEINYLNSLINIKENVMGVRLLTLNELTTLETLENATSWLYNQINYWTMTPYDNDHVYLVGPVGLLAPEEINEDGTEVINGVVNTPAGIRPVITVDKSVLKSSLD